MLTIHGLGPDFSTALINGGQQVSTSNNRDVEFDQYPSSWFDNVVVHLSPQANLIGQGLSGTVDMHTIRPLDKSGPEAAVNAKYTWNSMSELAPGKGVSNKGHNVNGVWVHQFADHTLGVTLGVDLEENRLVRVRENLQRLRLDATLVAADGRDTGAWWDGKPFQRILLDAPCSATGTVRRHPDVAWLKQEDDLVALTALQKRLLQRAVSLLKPGGTLVYCTCSLEPEEGEETIAALLASETGLRRSPVGRDEVAGLDEILNRDGDIRTLPSHLAHADPRLGGLDGFYAARLIKS